MPSRLTARIFDICFRWWLRSNDRLMGEFRAPWWIELRPQGRRLRRSYWRAVFADLNAEIELAEHVKVLGPAKIRIGKGARITSDVVLDGRGGLDIGEYSLIGFQSIILTHSHRFAGLEPIVDQGMQSAPVAIGKDVWLGTRVIVLPGVTIGNHVIVGAGAVVTRDVPEGAVAAGIPARIVRYRDGFAG